MADADPVLEQVETEEEAERLRFITLAYDCSGSNPSIPRDGSGCRREQFRYAFANPVDEDKAERLYEQFCVPAPGEPLFQAAAANTWSSSLHHSEAEVRRAGVAGTSEERS